METLASICEAHLVDLKWLLAPSRRTANQWIETLVRGGQPLVNLHPTTVLSLALDLVGPKMLEQGLTLASAVIGSTVVDAAWSKLPPDGYFAKLRTSSDLSSAVYDSLLSLRLAGSIADAIQEAHLESAAKWKDILVLLRSYEEFLSTQKLVDRADLLRLATNGLKSDSLVAPVITYAVAVHETVNRVKVQLRFTVIGSEADLAMPGRARPGHLSFTTNRWEWTS
jgi:ATP-dependent helicase/nuclease subunit B